MCRVIHSKTYPRDSYKWREMNPSKPSSSSMGVKPKKQLKMKGKTQPQVPTSSNSSGSNSVSSDSITNDKGSPSKDFQDYAGISSDSICIFAEQTNYEHLSEDVCNLLTEDINYKLRCIIHNALIKAKIQGREVISSDDIDETFSNLKIDKVYGAPSNPNWLPFGDNTLYHLDDQKVNLIEMAEEEINYAQEGDIILDHVWLTEENDSEEDVEEYTEILTEYFEAMCEAVISFDEDVRNMALRDISENPSIAPITDWFYHFTYLLLTKDVTYDCLTMRALQLLEVLENSPLARVHIYEKQLKLLVRILLQRLLISMSITPVQTVRAMCYVLSLLCLRKPLKEMVLTKLESKLATLCDEVPLQLLNIIYYLGVEAIVRIFLPNMNFFLTRIMQEDDAFLTDVGLAIYGLICKVNLNVGFIYTCFDEVFGNTLVPYWLPKNIKTGIKKLEIDFVNMKKQLIKTRRKVDCRIRNKKNQRLDDVFEIPKYDCPVRKVLDNHRNLVSGISTKRETHVTVGKTSLLLSVLERRKRCDKCIDHSLFAYHL